VALIYFDASALVKLVVQETGSDLAAELWDGCDAALASRLAYPEVRAALAAACRNHDLTQDELEAAEQAWHQYWAAVRPVELTPAVERHAASSHDRTRCAALMPFTWPAPWPSATPASSSPSGTGACTPGPPPPDCTSPQRNCPPPKPAPPAAPQQANL
jgi:predicted nucleic acid-binding protein